MATDEQYIQTLETMLDEMKADLASTDEADFTRPQTATLMLQLTGQIAQLRVEQRKAQALEEIAIRLDEANIRLRRGVVVIQAKQI